MSQGGWRQNQMSLPRLVLLPISSASIDKCGPDARNHRYWVAAADGGRLHRRKRGGRNLEEAEDALEDPSVHLTAYHLSS
jgi:hypothetical protein